jgi:hypothetical protein
LANQEKPKDQAVSSLFTPEGKPIRVLSTSLGLMLLANAIMATGAEAKNTFAEGEFAAGEPKLVEWSNNDVKAYYNANIDWSIPLTDPVASDAEEGKSKDSDGTTIVHNSGFGWESMLLYGLLMSRGSAYSSQGWNSNHRGTYTGTNTPYTPRSYSSGTFQNKQVTGSSVRPKTSSTTGKITKRSASSSPGSIGGRSSGLSSGSKSRGFGG